MPSDATIRLINMTYQIIKYRTSLPFDREFITEFDSEDKAKAYLARAKSDLLNSTDTVYSGEDFIEYTSLDQSEVIFYEILYPIHCASNR